MILIAEVKSIKLEQKYIDSAKFWADVLEKQNPDEHDWEYICAKCLSEITQYDDIPVEVVHDFYGTLNLLYELFVKRETWALIELENKYRYISSPEEVGHALKIMVDRMKKLNQGEGLKTTTSFIDEYIVEALNRINESWEVDCFGCQRELKIGDLKKQIRHCKNPMELKRLNRSLNELYKEKRNKIKK